MRQSVDMPDQGCHTTNTVIWDALKAVCEERDIKTARAIIDSAGIIVAAENLTVCYDTRGACVE